MEDLSYINYNYILVTLSIITSIITSYAAFEILSKAKDSNGREKKIWLITSAVILGVGIWSLHLIGMFSIDLPNPLNYRVINILISLGIALLTTLLSLLVMHKRPFKYQYLTSGTIIGIGFSTMHHIGMAATTFHYSIVYTDYQFIASLLFASIFSSLSFREYQTSGTGNQASLKKKVVSGLYMGLAFSGGHYLPIIIDKITYFYEFNPYLYQVMNPTILAVGLAIGTGMMVIFLLITSRLDWEFASQSEKIQLNEQYYKSLFEQNPDPILTFDLEGNFFSANKAVSLFIGYSIEELLNKPFDPLIASHDLERVIGHYYQALNGIAERAISTLLDLKKIGVKISIDDFGTGYSSLNYLKRFPIDKLKIDQSFIRECITDSNDEIIVKTIIAMAHNLKLQVIAEGVETKEQITFLLQQSCTEVQGFYFSKPIPVEEFENIYSRIIA
jgi:PAS domain S-box-containing protein